MSDDELPVITRRIPNKSQQTNTNTATAIAAVPAPVPVSVCSVSLFPSDSSLIPSSIPRSFTDVDLRTIFPPESAEKLEAAKLDALRPLHRSPDSRLTGAIESGLFDIDSHLPVPERPPWSRQQSADSLQQQEDAYFRSYLGHLYSISHIRGSELSYFEHNLNVWRQLWRVIERSEILLLIVDSRYLPVNFPLALYRMLHDKVDKPVICVLNKIDLLPPRVLNDWIQYFQRHFPKLSLVPFSAQPGEFENKYRKIVKKSKFGALKGLIAGRKTDQTEEESEESGSDSSDGASEAGRALVKRKKKVAGGALRLSRPIGGEELLRECERMVSQYRVKRLGDRAITLESQVFERLRISEMAEKEREQAEAQIKGIYADADDYMKVKAKPEKAKELKEKQRKTKQNESSAEESDESDEPELEEPRSIPGVLGLLEASEEKNSADYLTLGTIGVPNSGKSATINSLAGSKVVSVSKTPGHTKHLQTLFLNPRVRLCDCPGLVFPSINISKALQTLCGQYPIAQCRDPYSVVRIIAENIALEKVYKLRPVPENERRSPANQREQANEERKTSAEAESKAAECQWSPWSICEALAFQKGFRTRNGDLDVFRAANLILRDVHEGNIVVYFKPPKH